MTAKTAKKTTTKPKTFQIKFDRLLNFFKREIEINFAFSLNVKKLPSGDKDDSRD